MQNTPGGSRLSLRFLSSFFVVVIAVGCGAIHAGAAASQPAQVTVEQLWGEAAAAQQAQQYSHAAALYRKILVMQPDLMEAEMNLGLMLHLSGDRQGAIACFQHVLVKHPDLFAPNFLAGLNYLKLDKASLALPYLQKATALQPNQAEARLGLANSYLQLRQYPEALQQFTRATELDSKNADAWSGIGATYLSMEKEIEAGIRHSSSPFRALLLGQSYLQQGQPDKAAAVFAAAAASSQVVPCVHSYLGFAYLKESKVDDAARQFQSDWDSQSRTGCLLAKLGVVAMDAEQADTDGALRELREAADIDPISVQRNDDLFLSDIVKAGVEARAREILDAAQSGNLPPVPSESPLGLMQKGHYSACSASLTASPRWLDAQNLRILSFCSYYIGRDDLVLTATGQILKTVPGDAEALYWRIQSVERLGLAALTTASGISPESASLHALSGDMLREKGDLASAADEYRKAIAVSPGFLAAHLGLARVLNSDHNTNEAEHELQYVLKANPDDPEANYLMGEIMVNRMNLADALAFLLKGLYVTPEERPYVHADLSRVYEDRGEVQKAIDEMKQALPLDVDGSYYFRLGRLYMKMGDRVNAALALDQSAKLRHEADAASMFVK